MLPRLLSGDFDVSRLCHARVASQERQDYGQLTGYVGFNF